MLTKVIRWYLSHDALPYWYLLIADCVLIFLAGIVAFYANHSAESVNLRPVLLALLAYLPCYLVGFRIFHTYLAPARRMAPIDILRISGALLLGFILIMLLRVFFHTDNIVQMVRMRDLLLQCILSIVLMICLRIMVRINFEGYIKRNHLTGLYGLSNRSLLDIELSSLLPRKEIEVDMITIRNKMQNKCILVTGAAGSIGKELVRLLAQLSPKSLLLLDMAETPLHDVRVMMQREFANVPCKTVVCNICHHHRLEDFFKHNRPDIIFHAAAYKHVPMMEDNPTESVLNNIDGTIKLANLAVKYEVQTFVMVSTDKAVNPTSIMGCSKRVCEIYCQSLNNSPRNTSQCNFVTTRFGNVLGSNGSVVPAFREQIRNGGPVYVTHPEIVRYFMLISEACKLVLQAATIGKGGCIYVFDMGHSVKIAELAQRMIKLSGKQNINIVYTGLRPGEKLYEEVLNDLETVVPTSHERIKIARVREYDFNKIENEILHLVETAKTYDATMTVKSLKAIIPEYNPQNPDYQTLCQS